MVKAIVSALATCMLYTGHEYPWVRSRYPIYIPLYSHIRYKRDRPSLSRYRVMASRASLPQKRTSGSDGLDGERKYKFNFEIKLRSVEEKETFKRRLSKVRGLLTPPGSSKPIHNLGLMYEFFDGLCEFCESLPFSVTF